MSWPIRRGLATITPALVVAGVVLSASSAQAAVIRFVSDLGPEATGATGTGFVEVLYDDVARTLQIDTTFSGLSGPTTVAHIHCCTAVAGAGTIGVAVTPGTLPGFPAGVTAATYSSPLLDLRATGTYTGGARGLLTRSGGTPALADAALLQGMYAGTGGQVSDPMLFHRDIRDRMQRDRAVRTAVAWRGARTSFR